MGGEGGHSECRISIPQPGELVPLKWQGKKSCVKDCQGNPSNFLKLFCKGGAGRENHDMVNKQTKQIRNLWVENDRWVALTFASLIVSSFGLPMSLSFRSNPSLKYSSVMAVGLWAVAHSVSPGPAEPRTQGSQKCQCCWQVEVYGTQPLRWLC